MDQEVHFGIWLVIVIVVIYSSEFIVLKIAKLLGAEGIWINPFYGLAQLSICISVISLALWQVFDQTSYFTEEGRKLLQIIFITLLIVGLFLSTFYDAIKHDSIVKHRIWGNKRMRIQDIDTIKETGIKMLRRKGTSRTIIANIYKVSSGSTSINIWLTPEAKKQLDFIKN